MSRSSSRRDVALEPPLDLGPPVALGVVGEELLGALDQVAEVGVGQPFGADQVVDDLPLERRLPRGRPGTVSVSTRASGLVAVGRVGELAEERLDVGERRLGLVGRGQGLGLDLVPARVVPGLLLRASRPCGSRGRAGAPRP